MPIFSHLTSGHKKIAAAYAAALLLLTLFTVYTHFFWPAFDREIMDQLRRDRGTIFSGAMTFISWWGMNAMMLLPVFAVSAVFFFNSRRREALFTLGVFIADGINVSLKLLFRRERPEEVPVFPDFQQGSFPSGHVVHYVVFFGFLLAVLILSHDLPKWLRWSGGLLCVFMMAGVSVARIYLGTHWPSDILAAYALGFTMLAALVFFYMKGRIPPWSHDAS